MRGAGARPGPLRVAAIVSITCLVGALWYWWLERSAERRWTLGEADEPYRLVLRGMFRFGRSFRFIVALCVTFYSAIFPFRSFAIKFFMEAHGATREAAGFLNSILPMSAMIAYRILPIGVPIAMMGIAFSLIPAVMWPSVAYIVKGETGPNAHGLETIRA